MEPLDSRKSLNLATLVSDCIWRRKKQTQRAGHIHHQKSPSPVAAHGWVQGKPLYFFSTSHPSMLFMVHLNGSQLPKELLKPPPVSPASAPLPWAVPLVSGSKHLLYPTPGIPCSALVAMNLVARSFSIDVLLPSWEKSSRLGLSQPRSLRTRHREWSAFVTGS